MQELLNVTTMTPPPKCYRIRSHRGDTRVHPCLGYFSREKTWLVKGGCVAGDFWEMERQLFISSTSCLGFFINGFLIRLTFFICMYEMEKMKILKCIRYNNNNNKSSHVLIRWLVWIELCWFVLFLLCLNLILFLLLKNFLHSRRIFVWTELC